jgi:hypothetical protein
VRSPPRRALARSIRMLEPGGCLVLVSCMSCEWCPNITLRVVA